jgi:hypothetical protein
MDTDFSLHKILKDSTRRQILLDLNISCSLSYMELMNLLKIKNTGRFNYYLKIVGGLIEKRYDGKYRLTERGQRAIQFLENPPEKAAKTDQPTKRYINIPKKFVITSVLVILICLSFLLSLLFINNFIEAAKVQWSKTYGRFAGYSVIQSFDGGYLVIGSNATYSLEARGYVNYNASLLKTDGFGDVVWQKTYSFEEYILQTTDGGYAAAGTSEAIHNDNGGITIIEQFFLAKPDSQGNLLWNQTFEDNKNDDVVFSFIETDDGGYAIVGTTTYYDQSDTDALLVKTDSMGNLLWARCYGGSDGDYAWSVIQTSDHGYAIIGTTGAFFWLIKIDSNGNMQWNKTYGGSNKDVFNDVVQIDDGEYVFSGMSNDRAWIVKTDSNGNIQWNATFDGFVEPTGKSIIETDDWGYALVGTSSGGIWLVKLEPSPKFILTILIAAAEILVVVVGIMLLIYFRKHIKI